MLAPLTIMALSIAGCVVFSSFCFYFVFVKRRLENLGKIAPSKPFKIKMKKRKVFTFQRSRASKGGSVEKGLGKRQIRKLNILLYQREQRKQIEEARFASIFQVLKSTLYRVESDSDEELPKKKRRIKEQKKKKDIGSRRINDDSPELEDDEENNLWSRNEPTSATDCEVDLDPQGDEDENCSQIELFHRRSPLQWSEENNEKIADIVKEQENARRGIKVAKPLVIPKPMRPLDLSPRSLRAYDIVQHRKEVRELNRKRKQAEYGGYDPVLANSGPPPELIRPGYGIVGMPSPLEAEETKGILIMYYWIEKDFEGWFEGVFLGPSRRRPGNYHIRFDKDITGQPHVDGIAKVDLALSGENAYGRNWVFIEEKR